jgi:23S rRNA (guanosine2251-2'-O)-methyltransferase
MEILYGLHPVEEALRAGSRRFDHVAVARDRHDDRLQRVIDLCRETGVRLRFEPREQLTQLAKSPGHQGVVAVVRAKAVLDLEDLFTPLQSPARLLLALDGVEDPQNLGALLRTADGAGVDGVVLTERRAAPLSAVAVKASAGAAEHVRIARVVNMTRSLEQLKQRGIWCVGLDERGTMDYDQFDYTGSCVLVLGREGAGLHDLVRRTCDQLLRIPMAGAVSSLNVSVAGAVVLYEAARQRRAAAARTATVPAPAPAPRKQKGLGSLASEAAWSSPAPEELLDADSERDPAMPRASKPASARVYKPKPLRGPQS